MFAAALGLSLKAEHAVALKCAIPAGRGITALLAALYLISAPLALLPGLINNYDLQMLCFLILFALADSLVKSLLVNGIPLPREKKTLLLPLFLLYKPLTVMLLSLAFALPGSQAGHLLFLCCIYAAVLLACGVEFMIVCRKLISNSQPAILVMLLLMVMFSEAAVRQTGLDKKLSTNVSDDHVADEYLGWIREDLLDYNVRTDTNNFSVGYSKRKKTIICFGGSTTEFGTTDTLKHSRKDYPYFLWRELSGRVPGYNVLNFGVCGWTTFQIRGFLEI